MSWGAVDCIYRTIGCQIIRDYDAVFMVSRIDKRRNLSMFQCSSLYCKEYVSHEILLERLLKKLRNQTIFNPEVIRILEQNTNHQFVKR